MSLLADVALVFVAGLVTALATGVGALPFFLVDSIGDRWTVALWGLASGIMLSASVFGLLKEGLAEARGDLAPLVAGLAAGVVLVVIADRLLERIDMGSSGPPADPERRSDVDPSPDRAPDGGHAHGTHTGGQGTHSHDHATHGHDHGIDPAAIVEGDVRKLVLILGVLTVHSFPEGIAIGVSFAELGLEGGISVLGFAVPILAVFMTVAISIHNVPEGLAIAIPLEALGVSRWRMVGAAVFSSLPQPIGAVIAFLFVQWARAFLPFGFGLAAGAMIYLVVTEFLPEALERGAHLPHRGLRELTAGILTGVGLMVPLVLI